MNKEEAIFNSERLGRVKLDEAIDEIIVFIKKEPDRFYKIIVGSDSKASESSSLVTAITVWRVGNGGFRFWTKSEERRFSSLRERIYQEAMNSITLAQEIRGRLRDRLGDEFFWDGNEIHVDIGENGPTKELIDTIVGMIKGFNFVPVIKPYAFGASVVADRNT